MIDLGWTELLVIGIVALIVVGPKDLPVMFRKLGQFTGQARKMAREFTRAMDEAASESGVKDIKSDLRKMTDPKQMGMDALKDATDGFDDWDPSKVSPGSDAGAAAKASASAGPETRKLAEERAEAARRRHEERRLEREAAAAAKAEAEKKSDGDAA